MCRPFGTSLFNLTRHYRSGLQAVPSLAGLPGVSAWEKNRRFLHLRFSLTLPKCHIVPATVTVAVACWPAVLLVPAAGFAPLAALAWAAAA